jgi:iron complex outermembrane receptor protein
MYLYAACVANAFAQDPGLTEKDFLGELPVVFTVSRLPQPQNEAPGAVTVIDRELIRRSGAREIADLLRLVPGFQVTYARGGNGLAPYHGAFFDQTPRLQVLVDGRAVYSPHYTGATAFGMRTIALEDIERIEILRGSNAANYGARAYLGVVNIITRDVDDTHGAMASITAGNRDIGDQAARIGWGDADAAFRLTGNRRGDDGLQGAPDKNLLGNLNFRGDIRLGVRDELEIRAGASNQSLSDGLPGEPSSPLHYRTYYSRHLQADWRRTFGPDEELLVQLAHTRERYDDNWFVALPAPLIGAPVDFGGAGRIDSLGFNHRFQAGSDSRVSWGGELRSEQDQGRQIFNSDRWVATRYRRLYGNLETRLTPGVLLNAGAMLENGSDYGTTLMPRVMLNWRVHPEHTLRFGSSSGRRDPSLFERHADQRVVAADATLVDWAWLAHEGVRPEKMRVVEAGWFGELRRAGIAVDARLFRERISGFLEFVAEPLPPGTELAGDTVFAFINGRKITIDGLELQGKWQPRPATQLYFGHAYLDTRVAADAQLADSLGVLSMPRRATSLAWIERWPAGVETTVTHLRSGAISWAGAGEEVAPWHRTDLRVGYPFRARTARGEASLVVQNLNDQPLRDYQGPFEFRRRVYAVLKLEL